MATYTINTEIDAETEAYLKALGFPERKPDRTLNNQKISLIHISAYDKIQDGTELISISGERCIKGVDRIDMDHRGGWLAYGVLIK